ncbi:MAG: LuxR C-terminal-related transcriptional regulator, partial [Candidatus Kapaibacterium sp.]
RTLPIVYRNEENSRPDLELDKCLLRFVAYDSYYFLALNADKKVDNIISIETQAEKNTLEYSIKTTVMKDADLAFDEVAEEIHQTWLRNGREKYPDKGSFDYYKIISREEPKAMAGFFRFFRKSEDKSFTKEEKRIFETLAPHILRLTRTFNSFGLRSKAHQYFKIYTDICSRLVQDYDLSDAEHKIMIELLFGKSNEVIATENFVSVAAIKKHIKSILKKTGAKNRVDFIGKFFTSPERMTF